MKVTVKPLITSIYKRLNQTNRRYLPAPFSPMNSTPVRGQVGLHRRGSGFIAKGSPERLL